jgi:predicted Fe-Mo cluster-binding NifX family protein
MKIAIPVDEKSFQSNVCISFGRAPNFLIYDTAAKIIHYVENSAAASQGGAGIKAAQLLLDQGTEAILTPRCGENAEKVFSAAKVRVYKTVEGTAEQNIGLFGAGRLDALNEFHPGLHSHAK